MKLTKKMIAEIEAKTSCGVSDYEDYYEIYVDNSCGEDFSFEINKGEDEIEDIISYCNDFDPAEHFSVWWGANRGEPQDPRTLIDNCEEIGEHLTQLADLLGELSN